MRLMRRFVTCCFLLAMLFMWSGCATTKSYEQQMQAREEKAEWDELPATEKVGYYLLGYFQAVLYGLGRNGTSVQP
jgi:hypothetical protein